MDINSIPGEVMVLGTIPREIEQAAARVKQTLRDLDEALEAEVNAGEMTAAQARWYRDAILGSGC